MSIKGMRVRAQSTNMHVERGDGLALGLIMIWIMSIMIPGHILSSAVDDRFMFSRICVVLLT